jgi:hypothetical protein
MVGEGEGDRSLGYKNHFVIGMCVDTIFITGGV